MIILYYTREVINFWRFEVSFYSNEIKFYYIAWNNNINLTIRIDQSFDGQVFLKVNWILKIKDVLDNLSNKPQTSYQYYKKC